jgi:hypothetical protein
LRKDREGRGGKGRGGEGSSGSSSERVVGPEVDEMAWDGRDYFEVVWAQAHAHADAQRQLGKKAGPDRTRRE